MVQFDGFTRVYRVRVDCDDHNHEPLDHLIGSSRIRLTTHRNFGINQLERLIEQRSQIPGLTAREIANQLCIDYPDLLVTENDIYYHQRRLREGRYGVGTSTQAFVRMLEDDPRIFYNASRRNANTGKLDAFFWVYYHNIEDWYRSNQVIMIDMTYKVNRFNLPLLQITGTTCLNTTFSIGFGLSAREDEDSFKWLLTQLRNTADQANIPYPKVILTDYDQAMKNALLGTFPDTQQQLCLWHINKNVTLNIKRKWIGSLDGCDIMGTVREDHIIISNDSTYSADVTARREEARVQADDDLFVSTQRTADSIRRPDPQVGRKFENTGDGLLKAWVEVVHAETEDDFNQRWGRLKDEFKDQGAIISYLEMVYLPVRLQFVKFAIKRYRNYGIRSTSRVESAHNALKAQLRTRFADLYQLHSAIWLLLEGRRRDYEVRFQQEMSRRRIS